MFSYTEAKNNSFSSCCISTTFDRAPFSPLTCLNSYFGDTVILSSLCSVFLCSPTCLVSFCHAEDVPCGVVLVGHDQPRDVARRGCCPEDDCLNEGRKPHLPGLQHDDTHRDTLLPQFLDLVIQSPLWAVQPERDDVALLVADLQALFDVLPAYSDADHFKTPALRPVCPGLPGSFPWSVTRRRI